MEFMLVCRRMTEKVNSVNRPHSVVEVWGETAVVMEFCSQDVFRSWEFDVHIIEPGMAERVQNLVKVSITCGPLLSSM